jgi:hypothetical protein
MPATCPAHRMLLDLIIPRILARNGNYEEFSILLINHMVLSRWFHAFDQPDDISLLCLESSAVGVLSQLLQSRPHLQILLV